MDDGSTSGSGGSSRSSSGARRWLRLAAALVVAILLAGAAYVLWDGPTSKYQGPDGAPKVLIVGDSITVLSKPALRFSLSPHFRTRIEARSGDRTDEMRGRLDAGLTDAAGRPDAVIINLGTNDASQAKNDITTNYHRLLSDAKGVPCTVVTTVNDVADLKGNRAESLNRDLRSMAASQTRIVVADWADLVKGRPDLVSDVDAIHPTRAGRVALTKLYLSALARCPEPAVAKAARAQID